MTGKNEVNDTVELSPIGRKLLALFALIRDIEMGGFGERHLTTILDIDKQTIDGELKNLIELGFITTSGTIVKH